VGEPQDRRRETNGWLVTAARLRSGAAVAPGIFRAWLRAPEVARRARAGQFVQVRCRRPEEDTPLLRRPLSICGCDPAAGEIGLLYRVAGRGTDWLSRLAPGDGVGIVGPLGRPWTPARPGGLIVCGGGVGAAPLLTAAAEAAAEGHRVSALLGARSRADLVLVDEFRALGVEVDTSTDDGSAGHHGVVTDLLRRRLDERMTGPVGDAGRDATTNVLACGPLPMLRQVAAVCRGRAKVDVYVSLETQMACGVGACFGCAWPARAVDPAAESGRPTATAPQERRYVRVCHDGPTFPLEAVDLKAAPGGPPVGPAPGLSFTGSPAEPPAERGDDEAGERGECGDDLQAW